MKLSEEQVKKFDEDGYIFLPSCFSAEEIRVLNEAAIEIYNSDREEVWRESSGVARTAFAAAGACGKAEGGGGAVATGGPFIGSGGAGMF